MLRVLDRIDEHCERKRDGNRLPPPDRPPAVRIPAGPVSLDLAAIGISTATWYRREYPWLHVQVLDADGEIVHRQGVTPAPGLYVLGLKFQRRRASHFIGGVGADAAWIADRIAGAGADRPAAAPLVPTAAPGVPRSPDPGRAESVSPEARGHHESAGCTPSEAGSAMSAPPSGDPVWEEHMERWRRISRRTAMQRRTGCSPLDGADARRALASEWTAAPPGRLGRRLLADIGPCLDFFALARQETRSSRTRAAGARQAAR